ncbi:MAG: response regulator [Leptolyngbyaceae cyanobacterium CSU_1_3]|nr:response regulator [Leptolyngbyaceae cyanobacterium CSU_1_3]
MILSDNIEFTSSIKGDILIVDDTLENLRLLSAMLSDQGYEVRSVTNGAMALVGMQTQPPDLVLLDINMPGMNGYEVCQRLKSNPALQAIPVIFISALHEALDKVQAFSMGGVDFITKPFQIEEVLARIEHQLTLRRLQLQLQDQNCRLHQTQAELCRSLEQEKTLNQRIEEMVVIEERNRIARDIHDSLGHSLVALNIQLEAALTLWQADPDRAQSMLVEAKQLGSEALQAVRESVSAIRSDPLQGQRLEGAIVTLAEEFYHLTDVLPACQIDLSQPLPNPINHVVYRIVQEGLTNICKHAAATIVEIQIQTTDAGLSLTLRDNGRGFQSAQPVAGYGLQGMQERAEAMGGQLEIVSQPGAGCQINAHFPRANYAVDR